MSVINHPTIKRQRREERESRPRFERQPLTGSVTPGDALALLCDPEQKLTAPVRRYLRACCASVLVMPTPVLRRLPAVKLAEKLASLPLAKVIRRRAQFARRAAGAKYQLAALSPDSRFRPAIQAVQDHNLRAFQQAEAEIEARYLHATQQLA